MDHLKLAIRGSRSCSNIICSCGGMGSESLRQVILVVDLLIFKGRDADD